MYRNSDEHVRKADRGPRQANPSADSEIRSAGANLTMLLQLPEFVRRAFAMLPGLIDHGCGQQPRGIEVAYCESLKPRFLPARQTMKLSTPNIPQLDVDAIGAALAEQEHGHRTSLAAQRRKGKTCQEMARSDVL